MSTSLAIPLKQCYMCNRLLPATLQYFHANKGRPDGLRGECKQCRNAGYHKIVSIPDTVPESYKRCVKCQQVFPATTSYFSAHSGRKDGLIERCKACVKVSTQENRLKPRPLIPAGHKRCSKCKSILPATPEFFGVSRRHRYGVTSMCKACINTGQRDAYVKRKPIDDIPPGYKRCTDCQEVKPATLEYFPRKREVRSGLYQYCKQCVSKRHKGFYAKRRNKLFTPLDFKKCSQCGEVKPATLEFFAKHVGCRDGLLPLCRDCKRSSVRQSYPSHREHILACRQRYRDTHPEEFRIYHRNRYALKKGASGRYTLADIERQFKAQKGRCYWCRKKFERREGKYIHQSDHYIPLTREGTSNAPWNIVLSCAHCNSSRGNRLPHEWPGSGRLF